MKYDITGKNAVITGAATGIGMYYVKEMLKHGVARVAVLDIDSKNGERLVQEITSEMGKDRCMFIKTDVTILDQLESSFKTVVNAWSTIDIVINNAGILNDLKWELEIALNCTALVRGTMLGMKYMGRDNGGKGGVIVNIASILGMQAIAGCPVYVGSKHFVLGLSRAWGMPFHYSRSGVRVLTMCPGVTDTPLISEAGGLQMDDQVGMECHRELQSLAKQKPVDVAKGMISILTLGESGSVWVCEGGQPAYEVQIPDRLTLRKN